MNALERRYARGRGFAALGDQRAPSCDLHDVFPMVINVSALLPAQCR